MRSADAGAGAPLPRPTRRCRRHPRRPAPVRAPVVPARERRGWSCGPAIDPFAAVQRHRRARHGAVEDHRLPARRAGGSLPPPPAPQSARHVEREDDEAVSAIMTVAIAVLVAVSIAGVLLA